MTGREDHDDDFETYETVEFGLETLIVIFVVTVTVWSLACYGAWTLIDLYWMGVK